MVRTIYEISGFPNNLTHQLTYVKQPIGNPVYMFPLHGILSGSKPIIYFVYTIGTYTNVTNTLIIVDTSKTCIARRHLTNTNAIISINTFSLLPYYIRPTFSNYILLYFSNYILRNLHDFFCNSNPSVPSHYFYSRFESHHLIPIQVVPQEVLHILDYPDKKRKIGIVEYLEILKAQIAFGKENFSQKNIEEREKSHPIS